MPERRFPNPSTVLVTIEPGQALEAQARTLAPDERQISFRVLRTTQVDGYETPGGPPQIPEVLTEGARLAAAQGDNFRGTARKAAKTSIAQAETEQFGDLKDLVDSLIADATMVAMHISDSAQSNRVDAEKRNVEVQAFIYAASREDDNDFHVIIGRDPGDAELYMNVEVSGLPAANHRDRASLQSVRDAYKDFFSRHPGGLPGSRYDFYDPPVPITIGGSLFFDVSHATGGKPGPADLRDHIPRIWEIHPITRLEFRRG